jgi:hypothetical protein
VPTAFSSSSFADLIAMPFRQASEHHFYGKPTIQPNGCHIAGLAERMGCCSVRLCYFNRTCGRGNARYRVAEKIAIKANLNNTMGS